MGENRSDGPRSCIPLATIPAFVMPFFDKSPVYIRFVTSRLYEELSERERDDLERMFVTKVAGEVSAQTHFLVCRKQLQPVDFSWIACACRV